MLELSKRIIEIYEENGIKIDKLYAAGGIAEKDELLMQIYADVLGREIYLSGTSQACAYGSAVLGAVNADCYADLKEAATSMKKIKDTVYKPNPSNTDAYSELYSQYKILSEFFAKNGIMKSLKKFN